MGKSEKIECAIPSAGQRDVVAAMEQLADEVLPDGFGTEWTGVTYQQQRAGNLAPIVFALADLRGLGQPDSPRQRQGFVAIGVPVAGDDGRSRNLPSLSQSDRIEVLRRQHAVARVVAASDVPLIGDEAAREPPGSNNATEQLGTHPPCLVA